MKCLDELDLMRKKYLIFDMDGTLIDSIGIWNITDYRVIKQFSGKEVALDVIQKERDTFLGNHHGDDIYISYCEYLKDKYHFPLSKEELIALRWSISGEYLIHDVDFKPDADILLKLLKQAGYTLVLATATTQNQLDIYSQKNKQMLDKLNIYDVFDYVIRKEDVVHKKPHPEIYQKILAYYGVAPEKCLVFEDSLHGIIAAHTAGIEVVNVYDSYSDSDREQIEQLADYKINSYREFLENIVKKNDNLLNIIKNHG